MNTNNNMARLVTIIIVLAVIVGVGVLIANSNKPSTTPSTSTAPSSTSSNTNTTPQNTSNQTPAANQTASTTTITYTNGSFSPSDATVKAGSMVKFVNQSSDKIYIASNPHPTHTANPELNIGDIDAGQSKTVTLTTKGTWGYHNHYQPDVGGTITVE